MVLTDESIAILIERIQHAWSGIYMAEQERAVAIRSILAAQQHYLSALTDFRAVQLDMFTVFLGNLQLGLIALEKSQRDMVLLMDRFVALEQAHRQRPDDERSV